MAPAPLPRARGALRSLGKPIASAFILLNLLTLMHSNRPHWFDAVISRSPAAQGSYRVTYSRWLLSRYAHAVGLDNRWEMFSTLHRFNWSFVIQAEYEGGLRVDLPLPLQSPRTLPQSLFADFREAKYHLNLYGSSEGRERYAYYLCRKHSEQQGSRVRAIRYDLLYRTILPPEQARAQGFHLEPSAHRVFQYRYPCDPREAKT